MKKIIVVALVLVGIFGITALSLGSRRYAASADALAGDPQLHRYEKKNLSNFGGNEGYAQAEMAAPSAPMPVAAAEPMKKDVASRASQKGLLKIVGGGGRGGALDDVMGSPLGASGMLDESEIGGGEGGGAPAATRAWFPETFIFEPLIVTNENGTANVPVKVPDRLTTWRVLALAHSRQGSQAGTVASFLGTLPTYVEPVVPPFLYAGDVAKLPVQVVNTTERDVSSTLTFSALGASIGSTGGSVKVPAGGSALQYVTLSTTRPGTATFKATLGNTDAIERSIELKPAGRREVKDKAGTLAQPRTFTLSGATGALPGSESVRVQVYPGAMGLLRNELSAAPNRGGVAEDAYLMQLLGQAPTLLRSLGAEPDEPLIRELSILATQRVMSHARAPSVDAATLLTEAALSHPGNPVLARLGERLAMQIAAQQKPDGTCQGENGWTLQRLLVATSECVRAVRVPVETAQARQRASVVTLKASGAFERNAARVADGYTAAAILASGANIGGTGETLQKLLLEKLQDSPDGKFLPVDSGVVRADGRAPTTHEATAMAILALKDVKDAPLADLGTYLLSGYSPYFGWGDGRANLVALRAAMTLFKDPLPKEVKITLLRDGKELTQGSFDAKALTNVLSLEADATGSSGDHEWKIVAEPPVPGMGYALQLISYGPWKAETGGGLALTTTLPPALKVGIPANVTLTAAMPAGVPMKLEVALPAGAQADSESLTALVSAGRIVRYETEDGLITLHLPPQNSGSTWSAVLAVIPTLGGTLQSGASALTPEDQPQRRRDFAPVTWKVD